MTIYGLNETSLPYCEAKGLAVCFSAYADYCETADIMEYGIGFNSKSGFVYIALDNGITICSMLGGYARYLVTDFETKEETFFDTYENATIFINA